MYSRRGGRLGAYIEGVETICPGTGAVWPPGAVPAPGDPRCYEVPYRQEIKEPRIVDSRLSTDRTKITYVYDDGHTETTTPNDPKYLEIIEQQEQGPDPDPVELEMTYAGFGPELSLGTMVAIGAVVLAFTRLRPRRGNRGTRGMG